MTDKILLFVRHARQIKIPRPIIRIIVELTQIPLVTCPLTRQFIRTFAFTCEHIAYERDDLVTYIKNNRSLPTEWRCFTDLTDVYVSQPANLDSYRRKLMRAHSNYYTQFCQTQQIYTNLAPFVVVEGEELTSQFHKSYKNLFYQDDYIRAALDFCHFEDCEFTRCVFKTSFIGASFTRCIFTHCEFRISPFAFYGAKLDCKFLGCAWPARHEVVLYNLFGAELVTQHVSVGDVLYNVTDSAKALLPVCPECGCAPRRGERVWHHLHKKI